MVIYDMISHDLKTTPLMNRKATMEREAACDYLDLLDEYDDKGHKSVAVGGWLSTRPGRLSATKNFLKYILGLPTRIISAPFLDAFGTASWNALLRRSYLPFDPEVHCPGRVEDCQRSAQRETKDSLVGFLDHFQAYLKKPEVKWEIDIIGHSMGAIVLNRILRKYPDLPVRNIVYMASATSVVDYKETVYSFLRDPLHKETKVYHLTLHPKAELREKYSRTDLGFVDLAPRGSLLIWIDNFLSNPNTLEDLTAGRFVNIVREVVRTPEDLRPRVNLKVFGVGRKPPRTDPQKHGDFDELDFHYWRRETWEPSRELPDNHPQIREELRQRYRCIGVHTDDGQPQASTGQ